MSDVNICLVVSCYFGPRRGSASGYACLEKLVLSLNELKPLNFTYLIIVVNGVYKIDHLVDALRPLATYGGITIEVMARNNTGFSYGAWNRALCHSIRRGDSFTHYFLLEDDYYPLMNDFFTPFLNERYAYTASLVSHFPKLHASIPNGLLRQDVARIALETFGSIFDLGGLDRTDQGTSYIDAERIQVGFLDFIFNLCEARSDIKLCALGDISANFRVPFVYHGNLKYFGNADAPMPIMPIL